MGMELYSIYYNIGLIMFNNSLHPRKLSQEIIHTYFLLHRYNPPDILTSTHLPHSHYLNKQTLLFFFCSVVSLTYLIFYYFN